MIVVSAVNRLTYPVSHFNLMLLRRLLSTKMTSTKYIHLYRHGLAEHNLSGVHDPLLTTDGIKSTKELLEAPNHGFNKLTLVLFLRFSAVFKPLCTPSIQNGMRRLLNKLSK